MLLEAVRQVLSKYRPMTVRQVYYRLVAAQFIKNELKSYKNLDKMLTVARRDGFLSYDDFIDRTRIADKESS